MLRPLYSQYPLDRRLSEPQSRPGRRGENSWLYRNSKYDPLVVEPVARRYTDCAIPALKSLGSPLKSHPLFRSLILPPFARSKNEKWCKLLTERSGCKRQCYRLNADSLLGLVFGSDNRGDMCLRNVGFYLVWRRYMTEVLQLFIITLWEPKIPLRFILGSLVLRHIFRLKPLFLQNRTRAHVSAEPIAVRTDYCQAGYGR
jgi:hypothetical protein